MNFMLVGWYAVWYTENNDSLIIKIDPEIGKLSYILTILLFSGIYGYMHLSVSFSIFLKKKKKKNKPTETPHLTFLIL